MKLPHRASRLLAVDPGVGGTGWALLDEAEEDPVVDMGTITAPGKGEWMERMLHVAEGFGGLLAVTDPAPKEIVMEGPQFMSGFGGWTVAVTGDLCKLAMLTGGLIMVARSRNVRVRLATPAQWKGQMSKGATRIRIESVLGRSFPKSTSHSRDAVGIGLWAMGRF